MEVDCKMFTHRIKPVQVSGDALPRDSLGGAAVLPADMKWPRCACGQRMVLFFQFDVAEKFGLPFAPASHLSVFMCPIDNEAPEQFRKHRLSAQFWKRRRQIDGKKRFYELVLHKPGTREQVHPVEPYLVQRGLRFEQKPEEIAGAQGFKVGGHPFWVQGPTYQACACGAEMRFLCQLPENFPFRKTPQAPEQPDSFSRNDYGLFLGNLVYLLACEAQCNPLAVHPVVQN
jgi:hypothetical protein